MNIIYAGTPEFAVPPLQALIESQHKVVAVYTQPDRPAGRGKKLTASPVKQLALAAGLEVVQPENFKKAEDCQVLDDFNADLMVVAAYGLILPVAVLESPAHGCVNIHASLLPRWRGAAPIQRAIEAGDKESGITIMQMARGLDTGDMLLKKHTTIGCGDTGGALHDRLARMGAPALMEALEMMMVGALDPEPQEEALVTYAHKLKKSEAEIDWSESAETLERRIRAFDPWPVCQTGSALGALRLRAPALEIATGNRADPGMVLDEDRQRGILVQCGQGALWIGSLQLSGKRPMDAKDFLNGRSLAGEVLA